MDIITLITVSSIVLGLFAVFFIVIVVLYNNRQRMYKQEKTLLQQNYENRIMQSRLEIAEDTAQKISRSLHDNIGQKLSAAKLLAGSPSTSADDIKSILGEVIHDVRDLSNTLKSEPKINKGLLPGLNYLSELLNKQNIYVANEHKQEPNLNQIEKLTIYRVCQEAVQNILKHANAKSVVFSSQVHNNSFILTIKDDGDGMDKNKPRTGNGLENMRQRCESIDANFILTSTPNNGCIISITKMINL